MADRKAQGTRSPASVAPPHDEHGGATAATANFAIGWVFTVLIAPLLFLAAALVPADRTVASSLGLAVGATGIVTLALSYRRRLVAAGLFLTLATWVILSVAAWFNGGEWSGAAALLPLVIVLLVASVSPSLMIRCDGPLTVMALPFSEAAATAGERWSSRIFMIDAPAYFGPRDDDPDV
ncbi:MAG: hypothetical protein WCN81_15990 [Actinomycetes bacterium]